MSDIAPPPIPSALDRVKEAMRWRSMIFASAGAFLFVILPSPAAFLAGHLDGKARPNLLTVLGMAVSIGDVVFAQVFLLDPTKAARRLVSAADRRRKPLALGEATRTMASIAAAFALTPSLIGFALLSMSGQLWRQLIFVPITLVAGVVYWLGLDRVVRELASLGVA